MVNLLVLQGWYSQVCRTQLNSVETSKPACYGSCCVMLTSMTPVFNWYDVQEPEEVKLCRHDSLCKSWQSLFFVVSPPLWQSFTRSNSFSSPINTCILWVQSRVICSCNTAESRFYCCRSMGKGVSKWQTDAFSRPHISNLNGPRTILPTTSSLHQVTFWLWYHAQQHL